MDASDRQRWFRMVVLLGAVYFVFGVAFAGFASWSASSSTRETWNRLGFLVSAVAFALHIGYEHFRLRNSPLITASHVSIAVALGALALAVSANVHAYRVGASNKRLRARSVAGDNRSPGVCGRASCGSRTSPQAPEHLIAECRVYGPTRIASFSTCSIIEG